MVQGVENWPRYLNYMNARMNQKGVVTCGMRQEGVVTRLMYLALGLRRMLSLVFCLCTTRFDAGRHLSCHLLSESAQ